MVVFVVGVVMVMRMCTCCHVSLLRAAPCVPAVVACAACAQYVCDAACARWLALCARTCSTHGKYARSLAALLALALCILFPPVGGSGVGPQGLMPYRTQFATADLVVAPAVSSFNRVGVFNGFIPSSDRDDTRVTIGPDSFADVSLVHPDIVDPSWETVSLPPMSVSGYNGVPGSLLVTAVKVPLRLQWGAPVIHVYAYVTPTPHNLGGFPYGVRCPGCA